MTSSEIVLTPGEAARRLDVSPSGLRRLAGVYAEVHGELAKDSSGTSRIWTVEAIERLRAARALIAAGQARSIKDGLLGVERGAEASPDAVVALGQDGRVLEALRLVANQLEGLQATNERLESEVIELRREVGELRALPPSNPVGSESNQLKVVEPQRREQQEWISETSRRGSGVGVRRPTDGGDEDSAFIRLARRLEGLIRRR